jgi:hypothetical protein
MAKTSNYEPGVEQLDATTTFQQGMNSGIAPELLPKSQLAFALNGTVRGTFITHRPPFHDRGITFATPGQQSAFEQGLWQGACWAQPSNAPEGLVCQIAGRLYYVEIVGNVATCTDVSVPGNPNPPTNPQAWLFQAEKWVILNDGASTPIFLDLSSKVARRSLVQNRVAFNATFVPPNNFVIPVIDGTTTVNITFSAVTGLTVGQIINVWGVGQFQVTNVGADPVITVININGLPVGGTVVAPGTVTWSTAISELPPGRMGAYWRGRIWLSLTDGIQFLAGDIVGGPSGTLAENFEDAILKISENTYLAGGGNFRVPGTVDHIQAIVPTATLDASLGQGQLAVVTSSIVFSVNATVDRLTWQSMQNPILTESLLSNGGQGQNSTIPANGDTLMRSIDGIRSLILGRREFDTWGNVPQSREMNRILPLDQLELLPFGSAVVFENRFLLTASPSSDPQGVFHSGLVALNFDPISTLGGKAPSVYDGAWKGLNTLQLVVGYFNKVQRAFAFNLEFRQPTNRITLREILPTPPDVLSENVVVTPDQIYDNGSLPIALEFETPVFFKGQDPRTAPYLRLMDGECAVDLLVGQVFFQVFWRPDQYPCWIPWSEWSECAVIGNNQQPQFRPRMGFGRPPVNVCDPSTNRPLVEGYQFQIKMIVTGHCRVRDIRLLVVTAPQPKFAPLKCVPVCPPSP